ncbi:MAG: ATP-binding cassette domain-containing protein [Nitrospira sp.]|nr:ATP-binding cassette domain-containing protein [Nitrospira sp.]MCA9474350.1 ATP-binding cassette domain-containing protein [Nitrospira sp.]MCB9711298.1 ATP-binding cassette domain-containing protein [Nitrospiraceae bacterium]
MIEVQEVTKRYGTFSALDNISFSIKKGEIVAFLGPNGAGKTTTMRIITGFMPPTSGTIRIAGFDGLASPMAIKKQIGYLPETPPLYLELTVQEYLTFVGRIKGLDPAQLLSRMDKIIEQTGLKEVQGRVIGHLSRGYRQRVGLAQALIHNPPVLILDEPTTGLDPNQIIEIRDLIKNLAGSHTIILSTHLLAEATAICQRVIIIHKGKIVAIDTPEQLSAKLQQSETLSLTVEQTYPDFALELGRLPGVLAVTQGTSPNSFMLETQQGRDIRSEVTKFIVSREIGLLEIKAQPLTLEDAFKVLTKESPADR